MDAEPKILDPRSHWYSLWWPHGDHHKKHSNHQIWWRRHPLLGSHTDRTCTTKSAYFRCLKSLQDQGEPTPRQVSGRTKNLLKQVWASKAMAPRVQTFAWRILRRAIPTGSRAGRYTTHINKVCCRCQVEEDDVHLMFLCTFAKAAWFAHPWYIRSELLAPNSNSISEYVQTILSMNHPYASLENIFTFLWCLWKSRNDTLFNRKLGSPMQIHHAAQAILQAQNLLHEAVPDGTQEEQQPRQHMATTAPFPSLGSSLSSDVQITGPKIFRMEKLQDSRNEWTARDRIWRFHSV